MLLASPGALWGLTASPAGDAGALPRLLYLLPLMLLVGKFSGELFERMRQPAVLGELIAGAVLGPSLLGVIPTAAGLPVADVLHVFAEIGVIVLLFEIGLETDLRQLMRVGTAASAIALVGVALPFVLGVLYWLSPAAPRGFELTATSTTAIFVGATLTATSVGITVRVLGDIGVMRALESRLVLGAAVLDDILGLVILGVVAALVAGQGVGVFDVGRALAVAIGFLALAVVLGLAVAPKIFNVVDRMRVRGMLLVSAFAFALLLAAAAHAVGSATIIGAFAAGIILSGTNQFDAIEARIKPVVDLFTPIFFLSIGAELDVRLLNPLNAANRDVLVVGGVLFVIAVIGKVLAAWAVPWRRFNRPAVGIGMIPRGEVGLIFADIGVTTGVLSPRLFGAVMLMVIATTFITPPLLTWSFHRGGVSIEDTPGQITRIPLREHRGEP